MIPHETGLSVDKKVDKGRYLSSGNFQSWAAEYCAMTLSDQVQASEDVTPMSGQRVHPPAQIAIRASA